MRMPVCRSHCGGAPPGHGASGGPPVPFPCVVMERGKQAGFSLLGVFLPSAASSQGTVLLLQGDLILLPSESWVSSQASSCVKKS